MDVVIITFMTLYMYVPYKKYIGCYLRK